jgi:hypothetical protein
MRAIPSHGIGSRSRIRRTARKKGGGTCSRKRDDSKGKPLRLLTEGLAVLRAVDAVQADAFRFIVAQDFDSVAVEDGCDATISNFRVGDGACQGET